ncbi:MAG TPA: DUF3105 domain-containing protein [Nitrospiria bacterium]|nr:DUF3105 domain-containing protein [Nitrospiria bacterium]
MNPLFTIGSATLLPVSSHRSDGLSSEEIVHRSRFAGWLIPFCIVSLCCASFNPAAAASSPSTDDRPGRAVPLLGNKHITSPGTPHIPYNSDPPTSGPHVRWVAPWGVHKVPIPREIQVHNLEDAGVVVQYKCLTPCPDLVAKLEALTKRPELLAMPKARVNVQGPPAIRLVVAPYPTMRSTIALTAWGRIDTMDHYDDARILRFIKAYIGIDHHPAIPEP